MLEDLVGLAREKSSEKRRELMGRVADHFVEGSERYSEREIHLFGEVMAKLLERSDATSQAALSEKLSRDKNTPRDIALQLANEEISIARPMLENSPNLTSDDLMSLVGSKGTEYRVSISRRSDLNIEITDELIKHGEREVLRAISGNQSAPISDWGFGSIAEQAADDEQIQTNLASRKDMSLAAAKNVLPLLPPHAQQKLMGLLEDDTGELEALIGQAVHDTSIKTIENKAKRIDTIKLLEQHKAGERSLDSIISYLSSQDRPMDIAMVISRLSKIPEEQVASSLLKINGQGIVLLCKALNIGREAFHDLARMRYARLSLPSSKADELALAYEDVDVGIAQRTLRFVNVRNSVSTSAA